MKLKNKNYNVITIEVTKKELDEVGFDKIWDTIRQKYPENFFDIHIIEHDSNKLCIFFELSSKEN